MEKRQLILVVDDDEKALKSLSHTLSQHGYDVAVATSGEAALAFMEVCKPDLIILNITMPELGAPQPPGSVPRITDTPMAM